MATLYADLVITGGRVITVNTGDDIVEAVAVRDGKIVGVGKAEEISNLIGRKTEVLELKGQTVLPGFTEPHTHFMEYANQMGWVNAKTPPNSSVADILGRLRERAKETKKGDWIIGAGIEEGALEERRWPAREELDSVTNDHPIFIMHRSMHAMVANSKALSAAGIDDSAPQPAGGHMDRDARTGRLTGVLREKAAFKPVQNLAPPPSIEQMKQGLAAVGKLYATAGITSTHDAGAAPRPETYRAYQEAVAEGLLKTRVYLMIRDWPYANFYLKRDLGLRTGFGNERLRLGPVKTCVDGSIQVFTCAFYEPYITQDNESTRQNPRGVLQMSPREINKIVLKAHKKGYQVAIHAQGDYGIDVAIDAIENAQKKFPREDARHRIEHCQCVTDAGLDRMKELGIIASFYPHHIWYWADRHVSTFIGFERASRIDP